MSKIILVILTITFFSCGKTSLDKKSSSTSSYKCSQIASCSNTCQKPTPPGSSRNSSVWDAYLSAMSEYSICMESLVEIVNGVVVKK